MGAQVCTDILPHNIIISLIPVSGYSFVMSCVSPPLYSTRISPNGSVTHDCLFPSLLDVDCHMSILLPIARTDLKVATACLRDSSATCAAVFTTHSSKVPP